ncbi:MAG: TetR/AcrR family transcriptional regulator [Pseudomonadota bacterium]
MEKRKYDNRQREKKAGATRSAILVALAKQLVENDSHDFSVDDAAREAGVSTRTVFRHFPSKEKMLEGISEWVSGITGQIHLPERASDLAGTAVASFRLFDEQADLMRALLLSDLGRGVRSHLSPRRRKGIAEALAPVVADLPAREAAAIKAFMTHIVSAETWWHMREIHGIQGQAASEVVAWTIGLILDALGQGQRPGRPQRT